MSCCLKVQFNAPKLSVSVGNVTVSGDVDVRPLTVTENGTYSEPGVAYAPVDVDVAGLVPTGTLEIDENGIYDVTEKATAHVAVPQPSGSISITENGAADVTDYTEAIVNVKTWDNTLIEILDGTATGLRDLPSSVTKIKDYAFYHPSRNLPSDYIQLESVHFNGGTVLDTGIPRERNCAAEIDAIIDGARNASQVLYGFDGSGNGGSYFGVMPNTSVWSLGSGFNYSSAFVRTHISIIPYFVSASNYSITVVINGVSKTRSGNAVGAARNVMIGGCINSSNSLDYTIIGTVYGEIQFFANGVLSYNLVPVKRVSDGKVGYYDSVNGTFRLPTGNALTGGAEIPPADVDSIETADLSVTEIGAYAFTNNKLSCLTLRASSVVTLGDHALDGTPIADGTGIVRVQPSLVSDYKADPAWSVYAEQITSA